MPPNLVSSKQNPSSFVVLHIGQAGIQVGNGIWELLNLEHGIQNDGWLCDDDCFDPDAQHDAFYQQLRSGRDVPNAIFADLEPGCIQEIKRGAYKDLFIPYNLINGMEDAAGNFARGMYSVGKDICPVVEERARKTAEAVERMRGIILVHSTGGGTGSGLTASIMMDIQEGFYNAEDKNTYQFSVIPSNKLASSVTEPYNALLHTHYTRFLDMNFMYDNESIFNICTKQLLVERPSFTIINRMIAQTFANITVSERFSGALNTEMADICTNLLPYPELHYPSVSCAPFIKEGRETKEEPRINTLLRDVYHSDHCMLNVPQTLMAFVDKKKIEFCKHKYIACANLFRGAFHPREVHNAVQRIKKRLPIVDWIHTHTMVGLCEAPCFFPPMCKIGKTDRSVTLLSNTTGMAQVFGDLHERFLALHNKKAFVHWYQKEGMPEEDWAESCETVQHLLASYSRFLLSEEDKDNEDMLEMIVGHIAASLEKDGERENVPTLIPNESSGPPGTVTEDKTEGPTQTLEELHGGNVMMAPPSMPESYGGGGSAASGGGESGAGGDEYGEGDGEEYDENYEEGGDEDDGYYEDEEAGGDSRRSEKSSLASGAASGSVSGTGSGGGSMGQMSQSNRGTGGPAQTSTNNHDIALDMVDLRQAEKEPRNRERGEKTKDRERHRNRHDRHRDREGPRDKDHDRDRDRDKERRRRKEDGEDDKPRTRRSHRTKRSEDDTKRKEKDRARRSRDSK